MYSLAFMALSFFAVPFGPTGGIFGNIGEPIICAVIIATAAHIARRRHPDRASS